MRTDRSGFIHNYTLQYAAILHLTLQEKGATKGAGAGRGHGRRRLSPSNCMEFKR